MKSVVAFAIAAAFAAGAAPAQDKPAIAPGDTGKGPQYATSSLKPHPPKLTETQAGEIPIDRLKLPNGFKAEVWASGMPGARMMTRGDKGKIYVGTRIIGRVYEVTDDGGKRSHRIIAEKLTQPNGVAFANGSLYVVAINKVYRYEGIEDNADAKPVELTEKFGLPPEVHHNWKFIAFGPDKKLYVQIGAPCNICEPSDKHARIVRYDPDGSNMEVVAVGVRNTVGFDWHPKTRQLWFTDNGRDWMGNDGPQDELNKVSKLGENFGFPYCHANGIPDQDIKKPDPCKGVTKPMALLGPHAGALGMRFYDKDMFPKDYKGTMFIARRGSWNRDQLFGYDVVNARPSADGKSAKVTPFLTGFMDPKENKFWGRPVDVLVMPDGALLVSDEQVGAIYRISYERPKGDTKKK
jgi:glucose/arabinose dehydrogenase